MTGEERSKVREALLRHRRVDEGATLREQVGVQVGIILMMFAIFLVGAVPVEPPLRLPFLWAAFMSAFFVARSVKHTLDARSERSDRGR